MTSEERKKVRLPYEIIPPPNPKSKNPKEIALEITDTLDFKKKYVERYQDNNISYYLDGKEVSRNKIFRIKPSKIKKLHVNKSKKKIHVFTKNK